MIEVILKSHPYLVRGFKKYTVEGPISVKDFCDKFNITLKMLPQKNAVGNHKPLISVNRNLVDENFIIYNNSSLIIMPNWILGSGPRQTKEEFKEKQLKARKMRAN